MIIRFFDAIIAASALEADCDILYSEDLQHQQGVENKLTLIGSFVLGVRRFRTVRRLRTGHVR